MTQSIAILIPYFGQWPAWIDFFVESCRANRSIDWILFGDAEPPENRAPNVRHVRISFDDYKSLAGDALGISLRTDKPYKLCDLKPALAHVHADLVRGYDFVGFGDLDVIYGDIRAFYDRDLLDRFDVLSSHPDRVSGHFCLMRNRDDVVGAFKRSRGWKAAMEQPDYVDFDERSFYNLLRGPRTRLFGKWGHPPIRCLFREAYSTPAATNEMRWYWEKGRLTNEFYPHHPFLYLHFMSWHSNKWHGSQTHVQPGAAAPWSRLPQVVRMDWRDARRNGFMISPDGIEPIERRPYP